MAVFYGEIGYGHSVEKPPGSGIWVVEHTERKLVGSVKQLARTLRDGDKVVNDFSVGNSISVVADAYAYEHFQHIKYIRWMGGLYLISKVTVKAPRLLLDLGGVYNGPTADGTPPAPQGNSGD